MRKFLVFLVFLLIMLVVADRGLHYAAQSEIAKRVSQQYEMSAEPEVTIGGFPFLTQAISGEYSEIQIVTGAITVDEVQLERVDVTARDVEAALSDLMTEPKVVAGTAEATVMLPYSELQKRLPEGIVIENVNGEPRMTGDLAVSGVSVPVSADLDIGVEDDTFTATPSGIEVGEAPIDVSAVVSERLTISFPIPRLPFDLQVTGIEALPNGIEVSAEASDLALVGGEGQR
ncbi:MAG: DUF2993 domain-containing protein [Nocardiopsaceae bacterium]|nr:DUF2993 domain-containing protein [Nocardiopsaceae bacterium]